MVGVGRYLGFLEALGDLLCFFEIHAPNLIQVACLAQIDGCGGVSHVFHMDGFPDLF